MQLLVYWLIHFFGVFFNFFSFQFMFITYILQIAWILIFCFLVIVTFVFTIFWKMCENPRVASLHDSIDLTQFCKFNMFYQLSPFVHLFFFQLLCSLKAPNKNIWKLKEKVMWKHFVRIMLKRLKSCSFWRLFLQF